VTKTPERLVSRLRGLEARRGLYSPLSPFFSQSVSSPHALFASSGFQHWFLRKGIPRITVSLFRTPGEVLCYKAISTPTRRPFLRSWVIAIDIGVWQESWSFFFPLL